MRVPRDDGGPAFPVVADPDMQSDAWGGMSLRDYIAAKAMQARLSDYAGLQSLRNYADTHGIEFGKVVADQAYDQADAMLAARSA